LVVDDDALVLSTLTELLRAHGHRVLEATKGRDGLELARAERPDLILVDYHMPEMDGLAVVAALKSDAATRGIPAVAFTSGTAAEANQHRIHPETVRAGDPVRARRRVSAGQRSQGVGGPRRCRRGAVPATAY
jgi:CheY-like chemotaxis protein